MIRTISHAACLAFLLMLTSQAADARDPSAFRVLPAEGKSAEAGQTLKNYLVKQAQRHFDARRKAVKQINTIEQLDVYRNDTRRKLLQINGPFPDKTPLRARVVGKIDCQGYTIEKVIYESRPRHHVTANLYLPKKRKGRVPTVLVPCGHSRKGKAYPSYQSICISLAQNGMAAFIYDPTGQAERRQVLDDAGRPLVGPANEHTAGGVGALLVGLGAANYMIWDGIRGIDYLETRPEIDAEKIGCTGNSGGGTLTAYLMAVEPRIKAAAPSCWLTTQEHMFKTIGPQDSEQNFPAQTAMGIEHADYMTLTAPRPVLMCVARFDEFGIDGSWQSFREAKGFYGLLGHGHCIDLFEYPDKHGFSKPRRQAAMRFMRRWLMGKDDSPPEGEMTLLDEKDLQCTKTGQVLAEFKGDSLHDLNAKRAASLAAARKRLWKKSPNKALSEAQRLAGIRLPVRLPSVTSKGLIPTKEEVTLGYGTNPETGHAHSTAQNGTLFKIEKLILARENEVPVPGLLMTPMADAPQKRPAVLHVSDIGKPDDMSDSRDIARFSELGRHVTAGKIVFSIDARGFGETVAEAPDWSRVYFGSDYETAFLAMNLDRPLLGQRAEDILAAVAFLSSCPGVDPAKIEIIAHGAAGPPALHAAALDDRVASLTLVRSITSWCDVTAEPLAKNQLTNIVPFALEYYDLPNLIDAMAPRKVQAVEPVDPTGKPK